MITLHGGPADGLVMPHITDKEVWIIKTDDGHYRLYRTVPVSWAPKYVWTLAGWQFVGYEDIVEEPS